MRELKFRAWNGSAMEYGGFSIHATGKTHPLESAITSVTKKSPIMQFTGLLDKNGTEIYEGDIVVIDPIHYGASSSIDSFIFDDGEFRLKRKYGRPLKHCTEVIGNIHENPELIETP